MDNIGMLLVISGPSGSGKGSAVKRLDPSKNYALSISVTTRDVRAGEVDGKDYFFCTEEDFNKKRDNGELLEHAVFCGFCYGTPRSYVEDQITKGKVVVLEIDVNGALQIKEKFPDAVLIFLMPNTITELERRLRKRNRDSDDDITGRLKKAREEVELISKYDYLVINENEKIENTVNIIDSIVKAEYSKPFRSRNTIKNFLGDE